jgi:hypothetical protein
MKFAVALILFLPSLAFGTPKVNILKCMYFRSSPTDAWSYAGYGASMGYYDLADGEYGFSSAFWSASDGVCFSHIGTADDSLIVNGYIFEGEDIQYIDDNCAAQGISVHSIAAGQKRIARGEALDLVGTFADGSQEMMHVLFTPYEHLDDHIFDYARDYCSNLNP